MNRRAFLFGAGAAACARRPAPLSGSIVGREQAERGHRVRTPWTRGESVPEHADVVIVGTGVAGLCAAWRFRTAGFQGRIVLLELGDTPGGTAASGEGSNGYFPWGAHYITIPNRDAPHLHALLADIGVITDRTPDGPRFDDLAFCRAPEERLFHAGTWVPGLWPTLTADSEATRQRDAFLADMEVWTARIGADGRPAFTLPLAGCSDDPEIRALAEIPFADWLDRQGYTAPDLRWFVEYACRDDFGTTLEDTSAWAGIHYFSARRPWFSGARDLGTHVLTWPRGNGELVERILLRASADVVTGAVARAVEPGRVWFQRGSEERSVTARFIVLAVPTSVATRLLGGPPEDTLTAAPWRVAQLHVSRLPSGRGVSTAWDSVLRESTSLGYVTSTHQEGLPSQGATLTWYEPLTGDPRAARQVLSASSWEAEVDRALTDLAPAHADLRDVTYAVDIWHWGHGTVRPVPGLHLAGRLEALRPLRDGIGVAHTDLSGMSLFEEASWHGIRAAEEGFATLGLRGSLL